MVLEDYGNVTIIIGLVKIERLGKAKAFCISEPSSKNSILQYFCRIFSNEFSCLHRIFSNEFSCLHRIFSNEFRPQPIKKAGSPRGNPAFHSNKQDFIQQEPLRQQPERYVWT